MCVALEVAGILFHGLMLGDGDDSLHRLLARLLDATLNKITLIYLKSTVAQSAARSSVLLGSKIK